MTPELANAIRNLDRARIEAGSTLQRNYPDLARAIDALLKAARKGTR